MLEKSAHLPIIRQKNTQNTATLPLQTCDKNQWTFLLYDTGVDFSSRNNSANLGSFAKVSVPVKSIIPCSESVIIWSCGTTVYYSILQYITVYYSILQYITVYFNDVSQSPQTHRGNSQ